MLWATLAGRWSEGAGVSFVPFVVVVLGTWASDACPAWRGAGMAAAVAPSYVTEHMPPYTRATCESIQCLGGCTWVHDWDHVPSHRGGMPVCTHHLFTHPHTRAQHLARICAQLCPSTCHGRWSCFVTGLLCVSASVSRPHPLGCSNSKCLGLTLWDVPMAAVAHSHQPTTRTAHNAQIGGQELPT